MVRGERHYKGERLGAKGEGFQERGGRMLSGKNNETKGRLWEPMSEYDSDVMQTLQREFAGAKGTKNNLQFLAHKGHDYFTIHNSK